MIEEKGMAPVGAYRLAYTRMGSGSPVVVLEAGAGTWRTIWDKVMPAIAGFSRVISYDRGSLGESERAGRRRTLTDLVRDLKGVLDYLEPPGPYLLVGSSFGGHIIRYFAYHHPDQVAGLVLIDSNHPDQGRRALDLLPPPAPDDSDFLKDVRFRLTHGSFDDPNDPEGIDFFACDDQAREASGFGDLPLVVISAGNHQKDQGDPVNDPANVPVSLAAAFERMFLELQLDLTRLSTRGRQVIAQDSGHFVHQYEPDLVVSIIKEMVEEYRAGDPPPDSIGNASNSHTSAFLPPAGDGCPSTPCW